MIKKINSYTEILFKKNNDVSTIKGRANERQRRIALTALTGALSKFLSMLIPLFTISITLNYLGMETYGLWMTVTSFFALFTFADLGLGNGIQTKLSRESGKSNDTSLLESKRIISNGFIILITVSTLLFILFFLVFPWINWGDLMNAEKEESIKIAGNVVFIIVLARILNVPLSLIQRTQLALQEGYKYNLWSCAASLLSLISIYTVAYLDFGKLTLITVSSMIVIVVSLLNYIVYFGLERKNLRPSFKYFDKTLSKSLLKTGSAFLVLSILTTIGLSMDNFIVARTSGLEAVSTYAILYKVVQVVSVANTLFSTPLWSANGEALARGDYRWVKKNTRRMSVISVSVTLCISILVLIFANPVFKIWINENFAFQPILLIGLLIMPVLYAVVGPYFMVLNGAGIVRKQVYVFTIYTTLSLFLKYFISLNFGYIYIPWVGVLCYGLIVIPPVIYMANKTINKSRGR